MNTKQIIILIMLCFVIISLVLSFSLPLFGNIELRWLMDFQNKFTSKIMDMIVLFFYFPMYYSLFLLTAAFTLKKDYKLFLSVFAVSIFYLFISYVVLKKMKIIVEIPARYLGARDLLAIYLPKESLKMWVKTWGFPSEHLVFTAYFSSILSIQIFDKKIIRVSLAVTTILIYYATFYMGDHYISDLLLNAIVAAILYFSTRLLHDNLKSKKHLRK